MGFLDDQLGIVTGAAVGLGKHYALALAREGCNLVVCDIRPEIAEVVRELQSLGVEAKAFVADVSVPQDVRKVVDAASGTFGRIDILINNAGIWRGSTATDDLDKSVDDYDRLIGVNLKGEYMFGRAVIPTMIAQQSGNIINISTDHVHTHPGRPTAGGSGMDLYDVSKWGLTGLTATWARELNGHGIRVNSFCMGATDSNMLRGFYNFAAPEEEVAKWMRPDEVCGLAIQLLREGPGGRTGENIGVWLGFEIELKANPRAKPPANQAV